MTTTPSPASLRGRPLPAWYADARLGIFIHWGAQSVPGWAPPTGNFNELTARRGWRYWFANNPYADWYANTMKIAGSPTQTYHRQTYGADFPYDRFGPMFEAASARWQPDAWAELFAEIGARYVVLTTKHHDGYLLWPSDRPNPHKPGWQSRRDLVGELTAAVRARGMKMGLYYSGGLDWTFNATALQDAPDLLVAVPQGADYAAYAEGHWRELIGRYRPSVLWNDIAFPTATNLPALFADYYAAVPDGVVNDRFGQFALGAPGSLRYRLTVRVLRMLFPILWKLIGAVGASPGVHADFTTPEYTAPKKIVAKKWETCRGIGYSFCYNRAETDEDMIPVDALVRLFVDIVSKNGNLLLNVGPMADGAIPEMQLARLRGLGAWLKVNGDAIFGTRPWVRAEGHTADGVSVRFTRRDAVLYAILLGRPAGPEVVIEKLAPPDGATVTLLGHGPLAWRRAGDGLALTWPADLPDSPAYVLSITPMPS